MDDHPGRNAHSLGAAPRRRIWTPRVAVAAALVVGAVVVLHAAATAQPASGVAPVRPDSATTTLTPTPSA